MTSKEVAKCDAVETRRRSPLDQLPPPANSNKPLTPFSIEDILNKPSVKRSYAICGTAHLISSSEKHRPTSIPLSSRALLTQTSPLCALEELASKTFKGLEVSVLQAAEGAFLLPKIQHTPFSCPKNFGFLPHIHNFIWQREFNILSAMLNNHRTDTFCSCTRFSFKLRQCVRVLLSTLE